MRFLPHQAVPRAGRLPDAFCIHLHASDAAVGPDAALRARGHTLLEYLCGDTVTKVYLDHETYFESEPTEAERAALEAAVRERCDDLVSILQYGVASSDAPDAVVSYRLATRHGFCAKRAMHKLSFRPFVSGVRIAYTGIPAVLDAAGQADDGFWDMSVYKASEQLLAAVNGAKSRSDPRVLQTEAPGDCLLDYVAQHVEPGWPLLKALPPPPPRVASLVPSSSTSSASRSTCGDYSSSDCQDNTLIKGLLACLSPVTADDRDAWLRVGMALRRLSGQSDSFFDDWVQFSRKGVKFAGVEDCRRNWDSFCTDFGDAFGKLRVGAGTLHFLARRDDPAAYELAIAAHRAGRTAHRAGPPPGAVAMAGQIRSEITVEMAGDLVRRLRDGFPGRFGALPDDVAFRPGRDTAYDVASFTHEGAETRVEKDYSVYTGGGLLGPICPDAPVDGPLTVHKSIDPALCFVYNRVSEGKGLLSGKNPVDASIPATEIDVYHVREETARRADIRTPGERTVPVVSEKKLRELTEAIMTAVRRHGANTLGPLNQLFVNHGTINVYNGGDGDTAFDVIRVKLLDHASNRRYTKAEGFVYAPVPGCPCAYKQLCTYEDYINVALEDDAVFNSNPKRFDEAMNYMKKYRTKAMPQYKPERNLMSFRNGVLALEDVVFTGNAEITGDHALCGKVARHHIDLDYTGSTDTPLLDTVLDAQFDKDVAQLLCGLLGRLLFPVGKHDNWQIMPYLVGVGGTGKSLILGIVQHLFPVGAVGNLAAKREDVFGMANLADKDVVIGRDMPKALSGVLSQELMQCMTAGEHMEVPRKGTIALNVQWTAPVIMASNHFPDYVNTGGNVSRRLVPFNHENPVSAPNETLLEDILATELPNVVARCLSAYRDARAAAKEAGGFWKSVPPKIKEWQGTLSAATNKLHQFLSMDDDERGCKIERVEGKVTWVSDFKTAYEAKMGDRSYAPDAAVFLRFGFRTSGEKRENVCKHCKQLAKARGGRCCEGFSRDKRTIKTVIYDLSLT